MKKTIEITKEQAVDLLKIMPSLTDIIYSNFPELKPKKRWFEEYEKSSCFHIFNDGYTNFSVYDNVIIGNYKQGFITQEQAKQHAQRLNLYTEMQVFANFRNGDWVADWKRCHQEKWGIKINCPYLLIGKFGNFNYFIFQIAVKSQEIAEEMLKEFVDRIKECFNLK